MRVLFLTAFLSLNLQASCITYANMFIDNTKRTLKKVSTEDLEHVLQDWIDMTNEKKGYLTGLSPDWNAKTLAEIRTDLYLHSDGGSTMYRNIVGNLDHEDHLLRFQESGADISDDLAVTLISDVQIMLIWREWKWRIAND